MIVGNDSASRLALDEDGVFLVEDCLQVFHVCFLILVVLVQLEDVDLNKLLDCNPGLTSLTRIILLCFNAKLHSRGRVVIVQVRIGSERQDHSRAEGPSCLTYLLAEQEEVVGRVEASAPLMWSPFGGRPELLVRFSANESPLGVVEVGDGVSLLELLETDRVAEDGVLLEIPFLFFQGPPELTVLLLGAVPLLNVGCRVRLERVLLLRGVDFGGVRWDAGQVAHRYSLLVVLRLVLSAQLQLLLNLGFTWS